MKKYILFLILVFSAWWVLGSVTAQAATINAASCSQADVQAAINSANTGDTIFVPSGTCTWSSALTINKGITLKGAGIGSTVITAGTDGAYLFYYIAPGVTTFRITGFTADLNSLGRIFYMGYSGTAPTNIRVDHNSFLNCRAYTSVINGTFQGVIDNNTFTGYPHFDNYGIGGGGQASWNGTTFTPGLAHNVYYEDNTFTHSSVTGVHAFVTGGHGGRYAYRYNDFVVSTSQNMSPNWDAHGNQTGGVYGTMGMEVYGNRTTCTQNINVKWFDQRGGKGMYFYNDVVTTGNVYSEVRDDYADTTSLTAHTCPSTAEYMYPGTSTCASNGEPQHPSKTYYWNNLKNNTTLINPYGSNGLTQNVHFWVQEAGSIECGTLAARPATCVTGEAYWATNQSCSSITGMVGKNPANPISGTLYRCASTNTWESCYTPYTYPHPLRNDIADTQAPTVPLNLSATAVSSSQINLSWTASTDNVGVTGYRIYRGGTQIGTSASNSYSDTGLSANTTYSYTVSAYDAAGNNSAQTSAVLATTLPEGTLGNLLANAYFESGFTNGLANGWQIATDGSIGYSLTQDTGYQGSAQKITVSNPGSWGLFFYQEPSFQLNQFYNLSFWYKTEITGRFTIQITNATLTQVVYSELLPQTNGQWTYKTITFQYTNSLADELRFVSNTSGFYWVDNVQLAVASSIDTTPPAAPTNVRVS